MKSSRPDAAEGGVVALIDSLMDRAINARASDVHFEPTDSALLVRFRVDGRLHDVESIPSALLPNVVTRLKVMAGLLSYRIDIPQEGGVTLASGQPLDVRISTFPTIRGERVAVRLLPREGDVRRLSELGLSDALCIQIMDAAAEMQGLIVVTGPAGSGKTTTLYALLRQLRETRPEISLMTVEDPVELRLDGVAQIQVTPHGELTYARALRSLLRQDPQVILIGEIRDAETARIATEAALTGHLILTTMHSGQAVDALVRLREMGVPAFQITSTVRLVICQRLVRMTCERCRASVSSVAHQDCEACLGTGYCGRTACGEGVTMSPDLRTAMLEGADTTRLSELISRQPGYVSLSLDARRHVLARRTTADEVRAGVSAANELARSHANV